MVKRKLSWFVNSAGAEIAYGDKVVYSIFDSPNGIGLYVDSKEDWKQGGAFLKPILDLAYKPSYSKKTYDEIISQLKGKARILETSQKLSTLKYLEERNKSPNSMNYV